jgi:CDGSH-type Zn-finger protein
LGTIRRTAILLRMFTPAEGVRAHYVEGGTFEVVCRCGKVSRLDWGGSQHRT